MIAARVPLHLASAGLVVFAACAPVVVNAPDVRSGFTTGLTGVGGWGPTYENGDDPGPLYSGAFLLHVAYGIRPTSEWRPALRVGVQYPSRGTLATDLYVQAPRRLLGPVAAGIGVLTEHGGGRQMPYAQAGLTSQRGYGANVVVGRYSLSDSLNGYTSDERSRVNWLNLEAPVTSRLSLLLRGGYASGHVTRRRLNEPQPYIDEDRWVRLAGATLQLRY